MIYIFSFRLRRAVLHPSLVLKYPAETTKFTADRAFVDVQNLVRSYIDLTVADNQSKSDENSIKTEDTTSKADGGPSSTYAQDVLTNLEQEEAGECPICMDVMQSPVLIPECLHQR